MSAETDTVAALTGDASVTAVAAGRLFYHVAPQGSKLPLIVYERTGSDMHTTISDGAPAATKVVISVSCWALAGDQAKALGDAVIAAMHIAGDPTNRFSHYDEATELHASVIDFEIWELGSTSGGP